DAGLVVPELGSSHIRELIHSPFRVVYLRQETEVVLIRVWRSERQLELSESRIQQAAVVGRVYAALLHAAKLGVMGFRSAVLHPCYCGVCGSQQSWIQCQLGKK